MMSAPTPRVRVWLASINPRLKPTIVKTSVTCNPIARTVRNVRMGRCFRFSKTSLVTNILLYFARRFTIADHAEEDESGP